MMTVFMRLSQGQLEENISGKEKLQATVFLRQRKIIG